MLRRCRGFFRREPASQTRCQSSRDKRHKRAGETRPSSAVRGRCPGRARGAGAIVPSASADAPSAERRPRAPSAAPATGGSRRRPDPRDERARGMSAQHVMHGVGSWPAPSRPRASQSQPVTQGARRWAGREPAAPARRPSQAARAPARRRRGPGRPSRGDSTTGTSPAASSTAPRRVGVAMSTRRPAIRPATRRGRRDKHAGKQRGARRTDDAPARAGEPRDQARSPPRRARRGSGDVRRSCASRRRCMLAPGGRAVVLGGRWLASRCGRRRARQPPRVRPQLLPTAATNAARSSVERSRARPGAGAAQGRSPAPSSRGRSRRWRRSGGRCVPEPPRGPRCGPPDRVDAAQRLVQDERQRVQVGRRAGRQSLGLLGGHVRGGADHVARAGQRVAAEHARDAEVGQPGELRRRGRALGDEHVGGLDVAVDHALGVRVRERVAQRDPDLDDVAVRQPAVGEQLRRAWSRGPAPRPGRRPRRRPPPRTA